MMNLYLLVNSVYGCYQLPESLTDRLSLTVSLLVQHFRTVLSAISWRLDDNTFPVLLLLGATT